MTARERLRALVDDLPEEEVQATLRFVEHLHELESDPVLMALREAPLDDEPLTDEDLTAIEEAREDIAQGRLISHEEIRRRFLGDQ
ncbi:MAG TPA: hypothetical protein VFR03_02320 [Thermoanaerobaculia bacterium]|nr:hypothetical protein [Thermoanaerobaculia bacterium]